MNLFAELNEGPRGWATGNRSVPMIGVGKAGGKIVGIDELSDKSQPLQAVDWLEKEAPKLLLSLHHNENSLDLRAHSPRDRSGYHKSLLINIASIKGQYCIRVSAEIIGDGVHDLPLLFSFFMGEEEMAIAFGLKDAWQEDNGDNTTYAKMWNADIGCADTFLRKGKRVRIPGPSLAYPYRPYVFFDLSDLARRRVAILLEKTRGSSTEELTQDEGEPSLPRLYLRPEDFSPASD